MSEISIIIVLCSLVVTVLLILVATQLRELHLTMNSRLDLLIATTQKLARAEGFQAGRENHLTEIRDASDKAE